MVTYSYRRTYTGMLKAVILDWDGVIVDHGSCASAQAFIELFRRHGVQVRMPHVRATMGINHRAQLEAIADMDQVALQWEQIHEFYPTQSDLQNLYREFVLLQASCLTDFGQPIAGSLESLRTVHDMGMLIGTTTCYSSESLSILAAEATRRGFEPDVSICTDHVAHGRPHPWMCFKAAQGLHVYPMEAMVKIGDTLPDIEEGLNAGMWTIAVTRTGNEVGLDESELELLSEEDKNSRIMSAHDKLSRGGAHYVVDSLEDVPPILEEINLRLVDGDHP